jgi:hypothetical protein
VKILLILRKIFANMPAESDSLPLKVGRVHMYGNMRTEIINYNAAGIREVLRD